jgi:hypothetical protein
LKALVTKPDLDQLLQHEPTLPGLHKTLRKAWLDG